jgi:VWFA-related protein
MRTAWFLTKCVALAGAETLGQERATFSSSTDLVVLHVTVRDHRGSLVSGLTAESFRVLEDDVGQELSFFRAQDTPVSVGLLIDSSGSMAQNRDRVVTAVAAFAEASHPEDEFFALVFNERVQPVVPAERRFTTDPPVLHAALAAGLRARGRTALYDAISVALDELGHSHRERQVIVVVSDGGDNASTATFAETLRKAQASNVVIYAVALVDPLVRDRNPKLLRRFADATGGRFFEPPGVARVDAALRDVSLDIRSGYTLAYVPRNPRRDGTLRRIRVDVVAPHGRRLVASTRMGYIAASERQPPAAVIP